MMQAMFAENIQLDFRMNSIILNLKTDKTGKENLLMIRQIAIFAENTKGAVQKITGLLAKNAININGFVTNDSAEYGIIRMVVSDAAQAQGVLQRAGYLCRIDNVTGVEINDAPGGLNKLLSAVSDSNVNIDYLYISFNRENFHPFAVFHTQSILELEQFLKGRGFSVMDHIA